MASNLALQVYKAFQAHLDKNKFKYNAHDEDLVISLTVNGDDLPINTIIRVMEKSGMKREEKTDEIEYRGAVHRCVYYSIRK